VRSVACTRSPVRLSLRGQAESKITVIFYLPLHIEVMGGGGEAGGNAFARWLSSSYGKLQIIITTCGNNQYI
jgi:hypothetical protein